MTGQPSVVEVLRAHLLTSRVDEHGHAVACCLCGVDLPGGYDPPVMGSHPQHQADALAAAGLLASGPTRESEAAHAEMCDREETYLRRVRAAELRAAADRLLAGLDENPLLRGLVSINGGAQSMRDYAVESLREDAARIEAEGGGR